MRKKVIAGNWKMNMLPNEAIDFIHELTPLVKNTKNEVILCVPYIDLFYALLNTQGTNINCKYIFCIFLKFINRTIMYFCYLINI